MLLSPGHWPYLTYPCDLSQARFVEEGINTETTNTDELWDLFDMDENGCIDQDLQRASNGSDSLKLSLVSGRKSLPWASNNFTEPLAASICSR